MLELGLNQGGQGATASSGPSNSELELAHNYT